MNISNKIEKNDNDVYRWYADTIVYRGFGPLIACLGFVGGTLSCLVFRRKALRKKSCSIYFLFLALADLLCMICWLVHFVLPTYNIHILTLSNFLCKIFVFAMYFAFDLANYILTACSIDRAVSVLFPVKSRKFCRRQMAYAITLILVIVDTLINSHLLYGFGVTSVNSTLNERVPICHHGFDSKTYQKLFSAYDSYVDVIKTNVIPFVIMSICNLIIIVRVCRSNSSISLNKGRNNCRTTRSKRKYEKDRQLTLMLLSSSFAFLVLTLPTEINDIIRSNSNKKTVTLKTYLLSAILLSLAHLNYAVHFYIYTLTGEVFRQQLIKLWPINIIWPFMIRLLRCKKKNSSLTIETTNNRTRQLENNLNTELDLSLNI
ncbi:unnamed protein product [Rotaria socialis]|uniref:G-protein coupled receptors family 1 profile domain-containing protein n=1 Tax=Rotaria socialis TaxID=392032 RepID=A0A818EB61_9BILA|nr:unnamed protein product [Rotaria socialis]CAF3445294.1 unnamed protein product [Rotaria socialis]CAF3450057.1 unnamed protein product [Rotaria socialis]CAF3555947.1 unnamed protein product [Rotaria socialis]CAF3673566.1 unnamed protein product [Rotaria socialis]